MDIEHRLGPKSAAVRSRRIIVQFTLSSIRDKIWKDAKSSVYLQQNNFKILDDLSSNMEECNKFWPLVKNVRDEGKKAFKKIYIFFKNVHCIEISMLPTLWVLETFLFSIRHAYQLSDILAWSKCHPFESGDFEACSVRPPVPWSGPSCRDLFFKSFDSGLGMTSHPSSGLPG